MSKFKLKLNKIAVAMFIGINAGGSIGLLANDNVNDSVKESVVGVLADEAEIQRREQVGFALLAEMLEKPFVKTFREYCEELISLWSDIPKFKEFCAVLQVLKFSKDPKDLKKALEGFRNLFPKDLLDRFDKMGLLQQIALKRRLTEAMNRK